MPFGPGRRQEYLGKTDFALHHIVNKILQEKCSNYCAVITQYEAYDCPLQDTVSFTAHFTRTTQDFGFLFINGAKWNKFSSLEGRHLFCWAARLVS